MIVKSAFFQFNHRQLIMVLSRNTMLVVAMAVIVRIRSVVPMFIVALTMLYAIAHFFIVCASAGVVSRSAHDTRSFSPSTLISMDP